MLLELFLTFAKIGAFTFGGGYAMISIIEDECVEKRKWITSEQLATVTAIAESTPGPIMVNLATYVGSTCGGFVGAIIATGAVVFPSFLVILVIVAILKKVLEKSIVKACLNGIKLCMIGIIFSTGVSMIINNVMPRIPVGEMKIDIIALIIMIVLLLFSWIYKKSCKKVVSPIIIIVIAAILGIMLY